MIPPTDHEIMFLQNGRATTQVLNEANPTSVVFPSVLFPSQATGTRDSDMKTASAIGSISPSR